MLRPIIEERETLLLRQAGGFVHSLAYPTDGQLLALVLRLLSLRIIHDLKNVFCYWLIPYAAV